MARNAVIGNKAIDYLTLNAQCQSWAGHQAGHRFHRPDSPALPARPCATTMEKDATALPVPGGQNATPQPTTPAPGGDTSMPATPAPGGDTSTPATPAPGDDTSTPATPAPGGECPTPQSRPTAWCPSEPSTPATPAAGGVNGSYSTVEEVLDDCLRQWATMCAAGHPISALQQGLKTKDLKVAYAKIMRQQMLNVNPKFMSTCMNKITKEPSTKMHAKSSPCQQEYHVMVPDDLASLPGGCLAGVRWQLRGGPPAHARV